MMKSASFDCVINSKQNKPLQNTFKCYAWALGVNKNDFSYTTDINGDYKIMKHRNLQIAKKGKGRAIMKKGIKYIEMDGKYYNYYSYINAGILIPEVI
jgi:predicted small secreted protein